MIILNFIMLIAGKWRQRFLCGNISLFLVILIGSCGISGNENKAGMTKEKGMASGNTNLARNNEVNTIKDLMPANTEKATFALG
jgi:hypothetical protein